jgi:hypothetical protein
MGTILAEEGTLFAFWRKLLGVGHFLVVGPGEKLGRVDLVIDFIGGFIGDLIGGGGVRRNEPNGLIRALTGGAEKKRTRPGGRGWKKLRAGRKKNLIIVLDNITRIFYSVVSSRYLQGETIWRLSSMRLSATWSIFPVYGPLKIR